VSTYSTCDQLGLQAPNPSHLVQLDKRDCDTSFLIVVEGAPPAVFDHSQKLFSLCFNTRRLIFSDIDIKPPYRPISLAELWPSDPITSHLEIYQSLPQLEEIILEFARFQGQISNAEIREMVDGWLSGACHEIDAPDRSRGPGAALLKSITVRMHSDYEPPYVEEYPWRDVIVLRLEMMGQANRLKYDSWMPLK
jgi:hypothetical protein